jgi:hypothetical protein
MSRKYQQWFFIKLNTGKYPRGAYRLGFGWICRIPGSKPAVKPVIFTDKNVINIFMD